MSRLSYVAALEDIDEICVRIKGVQSTGHDHTLDDADVLGRASNQILHNRGSPNAVEQTIGRVVDKRTTRRLLAEGYWGFTPPQQ